MVLERREARVNQSIKTPPNQTPPRQARFSLKIDLSTAWGKALPGLMLLRFVHVQSAP